MGRVMGVIPVHLDTIQSAPHPYLLPLIIGGKGWGEGTPRVEGIIRLDQELIWRVSGSVQVR